MASIWTSDSKIFGQATLTLQPAPATPALLAPWPFVRDTPAMQGAQTLLDLQTADGQPHVATFSFGLTGQQPDVVVNSPIGEVVAVINLGSGGIMLPVEVDVVQGIQYSLAVNRVQVHLVYRVVPNSNAVPSPPLTYNVGASVASGVVAHGRQPQRTLSKGQDTGPPVVPALVPNQADLWRIPAFAKSFKVTANPTNSSLLVGMSPVGLAGGVTSIYNLLAYPSADLPIPSSAYTMTVVNTGIANVTAYALIFDLDL